MFACAGELNFSIPGILAVMLSREYDKAAELLCLHPQLEQSYMTTWLVCFTTTELSYISAVPIKQWLLILNT